MHDTVQELVGEEIGRPVDERDACSVELRADGEAPRAVGGQPGGGGVTEVLGSDAGWGEEDGVAVVLDPVEEEGVGGVGREGEVLDLNVMASGARVEHDDGAVGEEGGGAGPDAVDVVPLVGDHGRGEVEPVNEVEGNGVAPCDVAPYC